MGLGRIDESQWLIRDEQFDQYLALKRRLLAEHHDTVFQALPGTDAAANDSRGNRGR